MRYLLFFITSFCFSQQYQISGNINNNNRSIENASVVIYDATENILGYSFTNNNGFYSISFEGKEINVINIEASSLGHQKKRIQIPLSQDRTINQSFLLEEKIEELNEVVLKTDQKIKIESDTITIKTKYFTNDTEQTVEDVLKRIPGIDVEEDGTIKANGKRIEKLLVEGDDLFDQNYKLLSKNLDGKVLDAVQILKNFEDNPILKQLGNSESVAINLKLKKDKLNIWFGNVTLGSGIVSENRWKESLNIGLIRKKIKLLYLADYNNSGTKASSQISSSFTFGNTYRQDRFEKEVRSVFNSYSGENTTFSDSQSLFNDAFFNTLAFNTKLKPNLSLRSVSYFALDEQIQDSFSTTKYNIEPTPISLTEEKKYNLQNKKIGGEIELKYNVNSKNYITANIIYKNNPKRINDNVLFNSDLVDVASKNKNYTFYNHIYHTFKVGRNKVINNYFYLGKDNLKEQNTIISPFLNDFFNVTENSNIKETATNSVSYIGFKSKIISKYKKIEHVISVRLENNKEKNENSFLVDNNFNNNYANNITLKQNIFGLENGLKYEITDDFDFDSRITYDIIDYETENFSKNYHILNTSNSLIYKFKKVGTFTISHNLNNSLPNINLLTENYQLIDYRSFSKGTSDISPIKSNSFSFSHNLFNTRKRFSTTTSLSYSKSNNTISSESNITNNFIFENTVIINGGDNYRFNFNVVNYFRKLKLATKLETQQTWMNSPIKVNTNEFSTINTLLNSYKLSGTTYFEESINFDFGITQNRSYSNFNNNKSTNKITKANLSTNYKFSESFIAELKSDFYWLDKTYSFININLNYNPTKSRFSYRLVLNNLLNINEFKINSLNQYTTNTSSISLIERYVLLTARYRF